MMTLRYAVYAGQDYSRGINNTSVHATAVSRSRIAKRAARELQTRTVASIKFSPKEEIISFSFLLFIFFLFFFLFRFLPI